MTEKQTPKIANPEPVPTPDPNPPPTNPVPDPIPTTNPTTDPALATTTTVNPVDFPDHPDDAVALRAESAAKITALETELAAAKEAHASLPEPSVPLLPFLSAEGISMGHLTGELLVNLSDQADIGQARRLEIHVGNRSYMHVGVDSQGRWTYRHDH